MVGELVGGWMRGGGWCTCVGGNPHIHAHAYLHTNMHVKHDKHGCLHGGSHLKFLYICIF